MSSNETEYLDKPIHTEPRICTPSGHLTPDYLVLKLYTLLPKGAEVDIKGARNLITSQVPDVIKPQTTIDGIVIRDGFAMIAEDTINVVVWGKDVPYLAKNWVYEVPDHDMSQATLMDANETGPFCAYELQLSAYESAFWLKRINTAGQIDSRRNYQLSYHEGTI
jgi:hypothetical protein